MAKTTKTAKSRKARKATLAKKTRKVAKKRAIAKPRKSVNAAKRPAKKAAKKKAVKRKRNLDHRDADHPIEVTKHFRSGPPGYLTPWQRAHHAGQRDLFAHGITPAKVRAKKNASKTRKPIKRPNSAAMDQAVENRKEFAGHYDGIKEVYAPEGTPHGLSRLGILAELVLTDGSVMGFRVKDKVYLDQDTKHKLHIVSTLAGPLIDNEPGNYGQVKRIEYIERKPHLGSNEKIQWVHKMGEVTGERPSLVIDKYGQLKLKGGNYTINWRGIIN